MWSAGVGLIQALEKNSKLDREVRLLTRHCPMNSYALSYKKSSEALLTSVIGPPMRSALASLFFILAAVVAFLSIFDFFWELANLVPNNGAAEQESTEVGSILGSISVSVLFLVLAFVLYWFGQRLKNSEP